MAKTEQEKAQLKALKSAYKNEKMNNDNLRKKEADEFKKRKQEFEKNAILTGILKSEVILNDDHPVYWDYCYVIDQNGGKVICSHIQGTVRDLKRSLIKP